MDQAVVVRGQDRDVELRLKWLVPLCRIREIKDVIFYDIRRCAVTCLADTGMDPDTIMKTVGHASRELSLRDRSIKAEKLDGAMSRVNTLITRRCPASSQAHEIAIV